MKQERHLTTFNSLYKWFRKLVFLIMLKLVSNKGHEHGQKCWKWRYKQNLVIILRIEWNSGGRVGTTWMERWKLVTPVMPYKHGTWGAIGDWDIVSTLFVDIHRGLSVIKCLSLFHPLPIPWTTGYMHIRSQKKIWWAYLSWILLSMTVFLWVEWEFYVTLTVLLPISPLEDIRTDCKHP